MCPRKSVKHILRETGAECVSKRGSETHFRRNVPEYAWNTFLK
ncbi:hypothetical protein J19TS1_47150 [Heyndrickxia oleronia]|nr:hypothetical protein J19TS1_47150 [Heyndrickxia oleronia]